MADSFVMVDMVRYVDRLHRDRRISPGAVQSASDSLASSPAKLPETKWPEFVQRVIQG